MEDCDRLAAGVETETTQQVQFGLVSSRSESQPPRTASKCRRRRILSVIMSPVLGTISLIVVLSLVCANQNWVEAVSAPPKAALSEYQLVGHAGAMVRLPCLIGKQAHCGEPYFIAWYKLNATSRQWTRIEARSPTDSSQDQDENTRPMAAQSGLHNRPLADRVQFVWSRLKSSNCWLGDSNNQTSSLVLNSRQQQLLQAQAQAQAQAQQQQQLSSSQPSSMSLISAFQLFDCAQLTIKPVELQDEGQYKCEITFSESVEFDRCPVSTATQLNVIARPNEPDILLNGRPAASLASSATGNGLTFKEGAQVRLECQSAGGKPAPRIEWLNLTTWTGTNSNRNGQQPTSLASTTTMNETRGNSMKLNDDNDDQSMDAAARQQHADQQHSNQPQQQQQQQQPELVQLMRLYWPIKRASYSVNSFDSFASTSGQQQLNNNINQIGLHQQQPQLIPVTSSSITITVSRFDLHSRFACLVLPSNAHNSINGNNNNNNNNQALVGGGGELQLFNELPAGLRNALAFNQAASQVPMLANSRLHSPDGPMLKWVQLSVLAKPSSASIQVLELPVSSNSQNQQQQQKPIKVEQLVSPFQSTTNKQPFYSLHPNRLYAIQCLVDNSRPRSQVAWFNRSAPIELAEPTIELDTNDYLVPSSRLLNNRNHRLSSFVRYIEQESGTFRTVSTLLLTTNFHDNFQELFCRVSNEAFQFDELIQVAPIISARIYVNYPPSAWLEAQDTDWTPTTTTSGVVTNTNTDATNTNTAKLGRLSGELGQRVQLRCLVGANPLLQNTIVQIDWLKDGRKLANNVTAQQMPRLQIEKANHLHMPLSNQQQQQQQPSSDPLDSSASSSSLAAGARLITASSLTISALDRTDSGAYSCQFKLIPAPSSSGLQQVAVSGGHANSSMAPLQFQQQHQARIVSGQSSQTIQLTVIEAKLPIIRISSTNGLFVYDRVVRYRGPTPTTGRLVGKVRAHDKQTLEVTVADSRAELSLKCDYTSNVVHSSTKPTTANIDVANLGRRVLWYLNGLLVLSSNSDLLVLRPGHANNNDQQNSDTELDQLRLKLMAGNGGRLSCGQQLLETANVLASSTDFDARYTKVIMSANEIDLRFKIEPKLIQLPDKQDLLMPPIRSFSELELASQPLNKLRFVCMAECEPLCSIEWLINKQSVTSQVEVGQETASGLVEEGDQVTGYADNETQIYKDARRIDWPTSQPTLSTWPPLLMESRVPPTTTTSNLLSLVQVDNLIHRKTVSSSDRFSWYKQTGLGPTNFSATDVSRQVDHASNRLMRDSYELTNGALASGLLDTSNKQHTKQIVSNVISKLELSYNQIGRLLQTTKAAQQQTSSGALLMQLMQGNVFETQRGDTSPRRQQLSDEHQILIECKLDETFGGRNEHRFGSAHVKPAVFHPYLRQRQATVADNDRQSVKISDDDSWAAMSIGQQSDWVSRATLNFDQVDIRSLFGQDSRQVSSRLADGQQFQTRILLERMDPTLATLAPSVGESAMQTDGLGVNHQASNFAINLNPQLVTNASNQLLLLQQQQQQQQRSEAQVKFLANGQNGHQVHNPANHQQTSSSTGSSLTPKVQNWLTGHQDRILVGVCILALVWLTVLFVLPLVRRRLLGSSKLGLVNGGRTTKTGTKQNKTTNWRFNKQHNLCSRTSSTNEINPFGAGGGGGSSSSSSVVHKFGLQQSNGPSLGFGAASACNYYGPPESNGADSSEQDMIQSCSQSSHYEEFIQHQIQQRLHNQPLYFNQAQLVESTTLSRRPLVQCSSATGGCNQNLRHNHQRIQQQQQQQQHPATMRANLSNVPLIGGLNHSTSSTRFNFSDLQGGQARVSPPDRYAIATQGACATNGRQHQQHHYSFKKTPLRPSAGALLECANGLDAQHRQAATTNAYQEPIYDDVN